MSVTETASDHQVAFEWSLEREATEAGARTIAERIRTAGGQGDVIAPPAGIAPLAIPFIILGVVAAVGLGEQVWEWWHNRSKHGLLIQIGKEGKVDIKELDIPYGQVVVISPDGTKVEHKDVSKDKLDTLLDAASNVASAAVGGDSSTSGARGHGAGDAAGGGSTATTPPASASSTS